MCIKYFLYVDILFRLWYDANVRRGGRIGVLIINKYYMNRNFERQMGSNIKEQDSFGIPIVEERDEKIEKIKSKLDHLQHGEIDQLLAMIEGFEAQSK